MAVSAEQLESAVLDQLRIQNPDITQEDLERPIDDFDLDSLDKLEVVHRLERESRVKSDKKQVLSVETLREFIDYFVEAAG